MSLRKKIVVSFFISAFIIAILAAYEYINFIEIRNEIHYLETTDTIRSKSLQLRRHEKNFFLYGSQSAREESKAVHQYLGELKSILVSDPIFDKRDKLSLQKAVGEYEERFIRIEGLIREMSQDFARARSLLKGFERIYPLIELTFLDRPAQAAEFLERTFGFPSGHSVIARLNELDREINALRKDGETIISISKDLDRSARENVDRVIHISQVAILIFFPLFFIMGIGMLVFISGNVVNRLKFLIEAVEKTGSGYSPELSILSKWGGNDEVGVLIEKFKTMEGQLRQREVELAKKNEELLQTKKLAALGTMAAGVAHELNNPLNNIYISTQILAKEIGDACSPMVEETVGDILSQTVRVKKIVSDILEFARGREPHITTFELTALIKDAYKRLGTSLDVSGIRFDLHCDPSGVILPADPEQMERVFINLFTNAVDAMSGKGTMTVTVKTEEECVVIRVSDTGKGIPPEARERVFEPFFTTKDHGTGLGLPIVFSIIKRHHGEITIESGEGKGTTFVIKLPKGEAGACR
jgi:signal transduction histidine kinase